MFAMHGHSSEIRKTVHFLESSRRSYPYIFELTGSGMNRCYAFVGKKFGHAVAVPVIDIYRIIVQHVYVFFRSTYFYIAAFL